MEVGGTYLLNHVYTKNNGGGGGGSLLIQSGVLLTIGTCYIVKVRVKGTHHDNKNDDWKGGGTYSEWGCTLF